MKLSKSCYDDELQFKGLDRIIVKLIIDNIETSKMVGMRNIFVENQIVRNIHIYCKVMLQTIGMEAVIIVKL